MHVRLSVLVAVIGLALSAVAAHAAANDLMPDGSWHLTCTDGRAEGLTLVANCRRIDGSFNAARLNLLDCAQPPRAENLDGELRCPGPRAPLFPGSWNSHCVFERQDGPHLNATCYRAANNTIYLITFEPQTCNQPVFIGFRDGKLFCESGLKTVVAEPAPAPVVTPTLTPAPVPAETVPPVAAKPAAPQSPPAASPTSTNFGDTWTVVTERGDTFDIDMKQTGKALSGSVTLGDKALQLNGSVVDEDKVSIVWQVGDLAGTGELNLTASRQELNGKLILGDGQPLQGGTWTATRKGSGPALPFGKIKDATALPQGPSETTTVPAGYERAVSTTDLAIRDKPTAKAGQSKVLDSLKTGEVVFVRCPETNRFWCELSDGRGWVSRQYLNVGATADASPPAAVATTKKAPSPKGTPPAKTKEEEENNNFLRGLGVGLGVIFGN